MPSVGALTTVRFGWGFSATGADGVRATPPPRGAPNIGGAGFGLGLGLDGDVEGAEVDADVPRAEAIRAASSRISACARSISSTARCCSSSASSGDLVVMPRTAATALSRAAESPRVSHRVDDTHDEPRRGVRETWGGARACGESPADR